MDIWHLKIFCKVIELRSFSKAGETVHISQPTVSTHIKQMEEYFNTRLVDRLARQALPTKAGELLYEYAHRLISLYEATETAMAEFTGKISGRLIIGGSTIPGGYLLPRLIGAFTKAYPGVRISLVVADTSEIIGKTLSGQIELGVVGACNGNKRLSQVALMDDIMQIVVPSDHRWAGSDAIPIDALVQEPFVVREAGSGTLRSLAQQLEPKGLSIANLNIIAELGSTEAIRQAIKNKIGISILSTIAVADDIQAGHLITFDVEGLDLKRSFYLTTHNQRSQSPLCRSFIDFLKRDISN
jgi:DNA-binding transcriptional LysR family regulator